MYENNYNNPPENQNHNSFPENQNYNLNPTPQSFNGFSENQPQGYRYNPPSWQTPEPQKAPVAEQEKKSKRPGIGIIIAIALSCSLVGAVVGAAGTLLVSDNSAGGFGGGGSTSINEGQREETALDINYIDTSKVMTAAEIYAINVNSTVGITTSVTTTNFFGYQTTSAASGSGFILTEDGYIVTNHHVIEGASSIKVTAYSGTSYDATLVGYDESNDLAVLKIEAKGLTPVVLGDSDKMNVGDDVVAIGNPLGELTFSLTSGAVSALEREVTMSNGISMDLIQTDCAINSGNSGGALFNMYGEVIGITNAKYSSNGSEASIDNIGFAIPINNVRKTIESIIETGDIVKPYIGVSVGDVSSQNQSYGVPAGAAVQAVTDGSPAQTAGLKANDVITAVNGTAVKSGKELQEIISESSAGDVITLTVYRQGQTLEIKVTVEIQRQSALDSSGTQEEEEGSIFNPFDRFFG